MNIFALLSYAHARAALRIPQSVARIAMVALAFLGMHPSLAHASNIAIDGEFRCISWWPGKATTNVDTRVFHALVGKTAMKVSFVVENRCACEVFVSKHVTARVQRCHDINDTIMAMWSPDYTWKLGNGGDGLTSWVVLMVRGSELFGRPPDSGIRRLSSTFASLREPFSLVTEGHYSYQDSPDGRLLICNVIISDSLRKNWRDDDLLSPAWLDEKESRIQEGDLSRYPDQFVVEAMRFTQFTNFGGLEFPMFAESTIFKRLRTHSAGPVQSVATAFMTVAITNLQYGQEEEPTILPVTGPVMLSERRLTDRELHLELITFHTNDVASFEITDAARAAFERERNQARSRLKAHEKKWYLMPALLTLFFGVPALLIYVSHKWRKKEGTN